MAWEGAQFDLHLSGVTSIRAMVGTSQANVRKVIQTWLYSEANIIMTDAKKRCPVDTGALRGSGVVTLPKWSGDRCSVFIGFGGPAAAYAYYVHENLTARHPVGEAKFLERAYLEREPQSIAALKAALDRANVVVTS